MLHQCHRLNCLRAVRGNRVWVCWSSCAHGFKTQLDSGTPPGLGHWTKVDRPLVPHSTSCPGYFAAEHQHIGQHRQYCCPNTSQRCSIFARTKRRMTGSPVGEPEDSNAIHHSRQHDAATLFCPSTGLSATPQSSLVPLCGQHAGARQAGLKPQKCQSDLKQAKRSAPSPARF